VRLFNPWLVSSIRHITIQLFLQQELQLVGSILPKLTEPYRRFQDGQFGQQFVIQCCQANTRENRTLRDNEYHKPRQGCGLLA
jgi:hypothetical protein